MAKVLLLVLIVCIVSIHAFNQRSIHRNKMSTRRFMSSAEKPGSLIKAKLAIDMKEAMKAKDKVRLASVRAIQTAVKQKEVDDRVDITDDMVVQIMAKLVKQRKESIKSYQDGGRADLAEAEQAECDIIMSYMPAQMTKEEIAQIIVDAIASTGASSVKDMGKVMGVVRPALVGKADMAEVSAIIKEKLSG